MRFSPWPRSLFGQLAGLLLLSIVLVQVVTVWLLFDERRNAILSAGREQVLDRTAALIRALESAPPEVRGRLIAAADTPRLHFSVSPTPHVAERGNQSVDTLAATQLGELIGEVRDVHFRLAPPDGRPPPDGTQPPPPRDWLFGHDPRDPHDPHDRPPPPWPPMVIGLSVPLKDGSWLNVHTGVAPVAAFAWPTLVSTFVMAVAVLAASVIMALYLTRPLKALSEAADRFGKGGDPGLLPETGPLEVRRAIATFNAMQERLRRFVSERMRMLGAISHDLRTPLTAMRLRAEFIDDDDIRDKLIEGIDEMTRMTRAVLGFVHEEAAAEAARSYDLAGLIAAVVDDFVDIGAPVAFIAPAAAVHLSLRPTAFKRSLRNLIENAVRYAGDAEVRLRETPAGVEITVADRGPGIPPDRLAEVFEPFVRLEGSRNLETGGVGLGLSIARTAIHQLGGELTLLNRDGGGLEARIFLPR